MSEPSEITGFPDPHVATNAGRNPGDVALHLESVLLENAGEVLHGLELLESRLAEREDLVDHLLNQLCLAIDRSCAASALSFSSCGVFG